MPPDPADKFYILLNAIDAHSFAALETAWIAFQTELGATESQLTTWLSDLAEAEIEDKPDYEGRYDGGEDFVRNVNANLADMRQRAGRVKRQLKKLKTWAADQKSDLGIP